MTDVSLSQPVAPPIIIQSAQVLLPSGKTAPRDVAIAGGKITAVGTGLEVTGDTRTIDGEGLTLLPGVIDPGMHLRAPRSERSEEHSEDSLAEDSFTQTLRTESCACVRGGITSFLEMPNTPPITTTQADLSAKLRAASHSSLVNYGFFASVNSQTQLDWLTAHLTGHSTVRSTGYSTVYSTGHSTGYSTCGISLLIDSANGLPSGSSSKEAAEMIESMFARGNLLISVHLLPSTSDPSPSAQTDHQKGENALSVVETALALAKKYERRLHISQVSTAKDAAILKRDKPSWISADVTPRDLLLDISVHRQLGALAQAQPSPGASLCHSLGNECDFLWQALSQGAIDFIATGHTSPSFRALGSPDTPSGLPGVETSLPLMLTQAKEGRCTLAQVANWMSSAIAEAFCIPRKGLIEPGYDADLVLVDLVTYRPVLREELQTQCGWSPFEGWALTGWPVLTIVGGQIAYDHGKVNLNVRGQALQFDTN